MSLWLASLVSACLALVRVPYFALVSVLTRPSPPPTSFPAALLAAPAGPGPAGTNLNLRTNLVNPIPDGDHETASSYPKSFDRFTDRVRNVDLAAS